MSNCEEERERVTKFRRKARLFNRTLKVPEVSGSRPKEQTIPHPGMPGFEQK
jgi:hypothetical protein